MLRRPRKHSSFLVGVEPTIASAVRGGDGLLGWKAVWDLAQSTDVDYRHQVLEALRAHARTGSSAECERARAFADALADAPDPADPQATGEVLSVAHERRRRERVQMEQNRRAMERIGIRPGEGIPMWALYMTRRDKRAWST